MSAVQSKSKQKSNKTHSPHPRASSGTRDSGASRTSSSQLGAFYSAGPVFALAAPVQTKLTVGQANDPYEREADAVADRVISGQPAPAISPIPPGGLSGAQMASPEPEEPQAMPVQRMEEDETAQPMLVQRMEEDETAQPMLVQRMEEDETAQPMLVQRMEEEETAQPMLVQRMEEEETAQPMLVQRMEEDETAQPMLVQRMEEEETAQPMLVQRMEEEETAQPMLVQRMEEDETPQPMLVQRMEEEETAQPMLVQRMEEDETAQPMLVQRMEEEETAQPMLVQRVAGLEEEEPIQKRQQEPAHRGPHSFAGAASRAIQSKGAGTPLNPTVQRTLESGMGVDLSQVRVHDDRAAHDATSTLKARAFTHRNHIWLGRGESQNNTRLMAHEATHVAQQRAAPALSRSAPASRAANSSLAQRAPIQFKLTANGVDDQHQQEADVRSSVSRFGRPSPFFTRHTHQPPAINGSSHVSPIQAKSEGNDTLGSGSGFEVSPEAEGRIDNMQGGGSPLPDEERTYFENRIGADFSDVRIHNNTQAAQTSSDLSARAFTVGNNIAFNSGEYQPGTTAGRHLLGHELIHTVQQGASGPLQRAVQRAETEEEAPSEEQKAAALAAAAAAEAVATQARSEGKDQAAQSQADAAAKKEEQEVAKQEATQASQEAAAKEGEGAAIAEEEAQDAQGEPKGKESGDQKATAAKAPAGMAKGRTGQKAPTSPEEDPGFKAMKAKTKKAAQQQKEHDPADKKSQEAQAAAEQPATEVEAHAQNAQVEQMEQAQTPAFDAVAFKAKLMERVAALDPKTAKQADELKESDKLGGVKSQMQGQVAEEKTASQGPMEEVKDATPDTGSVSPKAVTALEAADAGAAPADVGAAAAVPKSKGQSEIEAPLQADAQSLDQQMADADITQEQLANSNEPQFQGALSAKQESQAHAESAPVEYRQFEGQQLSQAEAEALASAQENTQAMHADRGTLFAQVDGQQQASKTKDEQTRAKIAADIQQIYSDTKTNVDQTLDQLDPEVDEAFRTGAEAAKKAFESYVDAKMSAYKERRYGGWLGWARWAKDQLLDMPSEVNAFYSEGRQLYLNKMDAVIDEVVAMIGRGLTKAKAEIAKGKQKIADYVNQLPEELQEMGQQAAQDIQSKFDDLEQSVNDKQGQLIDSLAQKYQENLQAVDARIEEMKAANRGLVGKAKDAIGGAIETIMQLKEMLASVLAKAADAIGKIIKDPIGFLGNLISGVKKGLNQFVANIGTHLATGLISWLTGTVAQAGITLPDNFDLQGIFQLVLQITGLSFDKIIGKLSGALGVDLNSFIEPVMEVIGIYQESGFAGLAKFGLGKIIGEKNVEALIEVVEMVKMVISGNFAALWELVKEHLTNLKEMVMGKIQEIVTKEVIEAGVKFVLSLFNPAGAFVKACMMIYDVVMFFVNNGRKIMALVNSIIDSVTSIANGDTDSAANAIEQALASSIPVAIGFLASLLGLGDLPEKIKAVIMSVRQAVDNAIDKILDLPPVKMIIGFIKKLIAKVKTLVAKGIDKAKGALGMGEDEQSETQVKLDDGEVGETQRFSAGEETHRLWVDATGSSPVVMIASNAKPLTGFLRTNLVKNLVDNDPQGHIDEVKRLQPKTESEARAVVRAIDQDNDVAAENADKTTEERLQQLVPHLKWILDNLDQVGKLKLAVSTVGIINFLRQMASGQPVLGVTKEQFFDLYANEAREWIKKQFRDADPGKHEWIPTNLMNVVVERASNPEQFIDGLRWVDLHHKLRVDTSWVIFASDSWKEIDYPTLVSDTGLRENRKYLIPHGHVGALRLGGYKKAGSLHAEQDNFHTNLRNAFDRSTSIEGYFDELNATIDRWVWDGGPTAHPVFPLVYYEGEPIGQDGTAKLAELHQRNYIDMRLDLTRIRREVLSD